MFWKKKTTQPNSPRCPECGHFLHAPGKTWTAQARPFSMRGENAESLTRWPPASQAVRLKSATRVRIEQSIALGFAIVLCARTGVSLVGWSLSLLATLKWAVIISSGTFALSVALGSDNWQTIFRWLDRNGDGRITLDDVYDILEGWTDSDESAPRPAPNIKRGLMVSDKDGNQRLLLPDLPVHQIEQMIRKAAIKYLVELPPKTRRNFSSHKTGKPFGKNLENAKAVLLETGHIVAGGNNTCYLTDWGAEWLAEALKNA